MDKRYASVDQIVSDIAKIQDGNSDIKYFDREEDFNTRIIKLPKEKIKENSDKNKTKIKKRQNKKITCHNIRHNYNTCNYVCNVNHKWWQHI